LGVIVTRSPLAPRQLFFEPLGVILVKKKNWLGCPENARYDKSRNYLARGSLVVWGDFEDGPPLIRYVGLGSYILFRTVKIRSAGNVDKIKRVNTPLPNANLCDR